MEDWTIQKLLTATQIFLTKKGADQPRLLSEILLAHVLNTDRVYLFSHFDQPISIEERARYRQAVLRCAGGEPAAYITHNKEFMSLNFYVTPDVLIPRPDTEILVETALKLIEKHGYRNLCDIGTGSGCIPISIAHYSPHPLQITAIDLSDKALEAAKKNASRHQTDIQFLQGSLLQPIPKEMYGKIELITANLPYIPLETYQHLEHNVRDFEPRMALTDEKDGLSLYRILIQQARKVLNPAGRLLLEIDPRQKTQLEFLQQAGFEYEILPDLAGRARVVCVKRNGLADDMPKPPATQHWIIDPEKPDISILAKAAALLQKGCLVAFPTETVYGLGASVQNEKALNEIFQVKGRPQQSPLLAAVADQEQLKTLVSDIPASAGILMKYFWPGPLSIIFPAREELPASMKSASGGIGIRMPDSRTALELIQMAGPVSAPSANIHGRPSPSEGKHVLADLNGKIAAVLDAGCTQGGVESTLVDCTQNPVKILRSGAISQDELETVLGEKVLAVEKTNSPYKLKCWLLASSSEETFARKKEILQHFHRPYGTLSFTQPDKDPQAQWTGCFTCTSAPSEWFSLLREAENSGIHTLLVHPFEPVKNQFPEGLQARIERTLTPFRNK